MQYHLAQMGRAIVSVRIRPENIEVLGTRPKGLCAPIERQPSGRRLHGAFSGTAAAFEPRDAILPSDTAPIARFADDGDRSKSHCRGASCAASPERRLAVSLILVTTPNKLTASINHERMPVLLTSEVEWAMWLHGTPEAAFTLCRPYAADRMRGVGSGLEKRDAEQSQLP